MDPQTAPLPTEIGPEQLAGWRESAAPHAVLDVREPWELAAARLAGSIDIPLAQLPERAASLPRDVPLVVMCHHGGRSARATAWLRHAGFANATNLAGGIDAWAERVDPSLSRY